MLVAGLSWGAGRQHPASISAISSLNARLLVALSVAAGMCMPDGSLFWLLTSG